MCKAITKKGAPCKFKAVADGLCTRHRTHSDDDSDILEQVTKRFMYLSDECINTPIEFLREIDTNPEGSITFEDDSTGNVKKYIITGISHYEKLVKSMVFLKKMILREDTTDKLKKHYTDEICKLEAKVTEHKNRYTKIHGLYENSIQQIIEMKRKLKESNTEINNLQQNKRLYTSNENVKACLMEYQTLDDFINSTIQAETGKRRGSINSNSIYEFIKLDNVDTILKPFNVDRDTFLRIYLTVKSRRINVAHPPTDMSIENISRIIKHFSVDTTDGISFKSCGEMVSV